MMSELYLLNEDHSYRLISDSTEWAMMMSDIDGRRVNKTEVTDDVFVSTVFLGIDHQYGDGPPILFETLVFGGELDGEMERYFTWDQAVSGHLMIVEKVKVKEFGLPEL